MVIHMLRSHLVVAVVVVVVVVVVAVVVVVVVVAAVAAAVVVVVVVVGGSGGGGGGGGGGSNSKFCFRQSTTMTQEYKTLCKYKNVHGIAAVCWWSPGKPPGSSS